MPYEAKLTKWTLATFFDEPDFWFDSREELQKEVRYSLFSEEEILQIQVLITELEKTS